MGIEDWNIKQDVAKKEKSNKDEKKINRRGFLKAATIAGVGLATYKYLKNDLDESFFEFDKDGIKEETLETENLEDDMNGEEAEKGKEEKERLKGAEKIAAEILETYKLSAVARRFDPKVFTKDFFMAQQYQESRYVKEAESKSGAQGVYQDKPQATQDVVKYLNFLRDKTLDGPANKRVDYLGPESISIEEAEEIGELFKKKADYGRAVGKLYLLSIHDKDTKYNNAPNRDVFRGKSPREQQKLLLISYHDGPAKRLNPANASRYGKEYVEHVFNHMDLINDLRNRFEKSGMSRDLDYAIIKIMRELERGENRGKENEIKNAWLLKLQKAQMAKWERTGNYDLPLNNDEIRKIFE